MRTSEYEPAASTVVDNIYRHLAAHQTTADGWPLRDLFEKLRDWAGLFIAEFKLGLDEYAVAVEPLPRPDAPAARSSRSGRAAAPTSASPEETFRPRATTAIALSR